MARIMPRKPRTRRRGATAWWLALAEVRKPSDGILFAEEVEGAFAWAAARARTRADAEAMIRRLFASHGLLLGSFENMFAATLDDIEGYDRLLAEQLSGTTAQPRCARGALAYFAAEAEA